MARRAGTLDYMSPEVLRCPGKVHPMDNKHRSDLWYTHSVDTWAVGVLAYELLNGCPPFAAPSRQQTEFQIMQLEPAFVADVSTGAEDFILACLTKDPEVGGWGQAGPWVRGSGCVGAAAGRPLCCCGSLHPAVAPGLARSAHCGAHAAGTHEGNYTQAWD